MKTLDLHGIRHEEVKKQLICEIEKLWNSGADLKIITGHSSKMKDLVKEVLKEYKLEYREGDLFGINNGYITTVLD